MELFAPHASGLLSPLNSYLNDPQVCEIMINRPRQVYVEKEGVMTGYTVPDLTERHLIMLCQLIANESQQQLNHQCPLLSATLHDGSRVQIVLPPTAQYPALAIRRHVLRHCAISDYDVAGCSAQMTPSSINNNLKYLYQKKHWNEFITKAIAGNKNIVISGGTSSGKTTFINACLQYVPMSERIILLEDAREVCLSQDNQVSLLSSKGQQGSCNVTMQDLVQCSLRLRPDRIIVGEMRGKEVCDFIAACSTGHQGSISSIHANNPKGAFMRMVHLYKLNNVPSMTDQDIMREIKTVVDVIVQLEKTANGRSLQSIYFNCD
ncbi:MAG: P-type DNA transfer ATPase VirB11 [Coxiellaceae bacterium]|nr:P-type DNA transfer ATPase VirB11 [Coxiellaceae bacterium]